MIINLTPHPLHFYPNDCPDRIERGQVEPEFTVGPSGKVARLAQESLGTGFTEAFDMEGTSPAQSLTATAVEYVDYGSVYGLPPFDGCAPPRTFYVVPLVVALAARDRPDLLVPYRDVRNMQGSVIGCRQLARPVCNAKHREAS
ncbi:hypothetical protein ACFQS1_19815 [Paractinoplanes rhizophilus]|jgi:hypothetical protein|uniref:Uncharacterized protein n=1 Tax=Paractinoplanes rhizophilus TaxID=1416877 RepID=A0ABW2HTS7_9ACTN